ncbi:hypothetical protein FS837_007434, partial [Tulasnella sp. UAMH 9824]
MTPQEVDTVMSVVQVNGEPRDDFTETNDATLHRDADAPFHMLLECVKASTSLPPKPSSSGPTSPISVTTFQAPSVLGDYAPSETSTDTDTMVTWQPAESLAEPVVESYSVEALAAEDERPDTPVGPRIEVHHRQPQAFETPKRQALSGLVGSSRSRSTLRLDDLQEPEPFDGTPGKKCCQFIHSVRSYAWKTGRHGDPGWVAGYAGTRFTDDALAWHSRQPPE